MTARQVASLFAMSEALALVAAIVVGRRLNFDHLLLRLYQLKLLRHQLAFVLPNFKRPDAGY